MKKCCYKRGFTLIELLVVVLIIGILAAIALPQYQKAVERARMAEAMQALDGMSQAQTVHYLYYGNFAADLETLNRDGDITIPEIGESWELRPFIAAVESGCSTSIGRALRLQRSSGKYQGGVLNAIVHPNGCISKQCYNPTGTTEFCHMAQSAGYTCADGAACN